MTIRETRRAVLRTAAAASAWLATGASAKSGSEPLSDEQVLASVDLELRAIAKEMLVATRAEPPFSLDQLKDYRDDGSGSAPLASPAVSKRFAPGPAGAPDVAVYVINASAGASRPAILHLHGGGFMMGSARSTVPRLQEISAALGCVIASVEYRLAPEVGHHEVLADAFAGLTWLYERADELGVDKRKIAVMGESAGGGLATLLALEARDRGGPHLIFQALSYPMLDDRTGTTVIPRPPRGLLAWTVLTNRLGWRAFLGLTPGGADVPVEASPARRGDLAGLPPAFIGVGDLDLLVNEDVVYGRRLIDAQVPTELMVIPGAFHAFDIAAPNTGIANRFKEARLNALRRAFGKT